MLEKFSEKFKCDFSRKYALDMSALISGRHLVVATGKDVRIFAKCMN